MSQDGGALELVDDAEVRELLADGYVGVRKFAELLANEGVVRGLIGPREVPRLWERHILNSAAMAPLLPAGTVADVGSGAGLPGVVLALLRPDVHMILIESMLRRTSWLTEVVSELGVDVEVRRSRAEDLHGSLTVDAVTARAVAPLPRLVGWTLPLLHVGGQLLAMKGTQAGDELTEAQSTIADFGGGSGEVIVVSTIARVAGTQVVRVIKEHEPAKSTTPRKVSSRRRQRS